MKNNNNNTRNVPSGEERGETDVFAGYLKTRPFNELYTLASDTVELHWSAKQLSIDHNMDIH